MLRTVRIEPGRHATRRVYAAAGLRVHLHRCCARRLGPSRSATELDATLEASLDPDNIPPRSRLFLVVPKNADGQSIEVRCSAAC